MALDAARRLIAGPWRRRGRAHRADPGAGRGPTRTRAVLLAGLVAATSLGVAAPSAAAPAQVPDRFTGTVDEFYVVPDPLPAGQPGELIRVQDVSRGGGATTLRIMYHSRDAADRDRAVTGIVTFPDGPAPREGRPVVSIAPGTSGMSASCASSRRGAPSFAFGLDAVAVTTDYIGLGPVGETHPYLSRPSEAHSVIDAVRAAGNLAEAGAGDRWMALGGSQGGHAAIAANELGESYAPELDLVGTVAAAPAALFDRSYGPADEVVTRIVGVMGLYGTATEHDEIDPDDYVGPQTAAVAAAVLPTRCLGEIVPAFLAVPADQFWSHSPFETEPARSLILANDVGGVAVDSPLMLITGTADAIVVIDRARDTLDKLCDSGQVTQYLEHAGGTHDDIVARSLSQITPFFTDRLAGVEPTDSCPEGPGPSPTTTTTQPTGTTPTTPPAVLPVATPAVPVTATPRYTG
jgi:hypothetical protein